MSEQLHEGDRYLDLLDLGHFADSQIETANGSIQARDFLEVCGEHALPVLKGFELMDSTDPRYEPTKNMLRGLIGQYISVEIEL